MGSFGFAALLACAPDKKPHSLTTVSLWDMNRQQRPITDRELKSWLAAGPVDRGVGEGLTFVASGTAAQAGKASWILRYRRGGRFKEKALGRSPELSLKGARIFSFGKPDVFPARRLVRSRMDVASRNRYEHVGPTLSTSRSSA